ncbi:rCG65931 [Rattus norvegicus]|uniref:LRRG00136 n=2 Tax=Rattus norvegicus TaxID=10116 RepID=F7FEH3_RAT|nr:LRRG00136 [Rattus norvegicus]EDM12243.1 rCG65931 [Rattus norvegicus]|eukprot:NP_001171299.1 uncharacterized protein LOC100364769 [Rattus norvegicus]
MDKDTKEKYEEKQQEAKCPGNLSTGAADKRRHLNHKVGKRAGHRIIDLGPQLGSRVELALSQSFELVHPNIDSIDELLEYMKGVSPADPKLQNLHDTNKISQRSPNSKSNAQKTLAPERKKESKQSLNHRRRLETDKHQHYGPKHLPGMCAVSSWEGLPGSLTCRAGYLVISGKSNWIGFLRPARRRGTLASAENRARRVAGVNVPDVRRVGASVSSAPCQPPAETRQSVESQVKISVRCVQFTVLLPCCHINACIDVTQTPTSSEYLPPKTQRLYGVAPGHQQKRKVLKAGQAVHSLASGLAPQNLKLLVYRAEVAISDAGRAELGRPRRVDIDIEGSKSDVPVNAGPPQASYPCGNFSDTSCLKPQRRFLSSLNSPWDTCITIWQVYGPSQTPHLALSLRCMRGPVLGTRAGKLRDRNTDVTQQRLHNIFPEET